MTSAVDPDVLLAEADRRQIAGDIGGALALYDRLIVRAPGFWPAHANRGLALAVIGETSAARAGFRRSIALEPMAAPALRNLADSLQADEPETAHRVARALVAAAPDAPDSWFSLGGIELARSLPGPADRSLRRALALAPGFAEAVLAFATTRPAAGITWLRRAVAGSLAPGPMIALARLATASGALEESGRWLRRAIAIDPGQGDAAVELTAVLDSASSAIELHRWARRALALVPGSVMALSNLGRAELGLGRLADAERSFGEAIRLMPDLAEAHFNRATPLFLLGRSEDGWEEYEWRWRIDRFEKPPSAAPRWTGEPLAGRRLLVHEEQGLGDTLQFVRYLPLIASEPEPVSLLCNPRLVKLLRGSFPGIVLSPKPSIPDHDLLVPLLSLPRMLGRTRGAPPSAPYLLRPEAARTESTGRLKVGLVWAGSSSHPRDRDRSIPLEQLRPWFDVPDVAWFSYQVGPRQADIADLGLEATLPDLGRLQPDLYEAARVLAGLDLLITVDTAACHLAGALGFPVWLLLARVPDWRWGMTGATTPWYPSMRLFRQPEIGAWQPVVREVRAALAEALAGRPERSRAP